jgi:hypothetical protein
VEDDFPYLNGEAKIKLRHGKQPEFERIPVCLGENGCKIRNQEQTEAAREQFRS